MANDFDDGKLTVHTGKQKDAISAKEIKEILDDCLPSDTETLIIFTQCFGGNMAKSKHFKNKSKTCVLSGTDAGQEGGFGGYHDDAAEALKPGANKTAKDVHDAGRAGKMSEQEGSDEAKKWNEEPQSTGETKPEDFPLDPTSNDGPIHSRHIVVFAGKPDKKNVKIKTTDGKTVPDQNGTDLEFSDKKDREKIKGNFNNQTNTTVDTVGGPPDDNDSSKGKDGWDRPGNKKGLKDALKAAGDKIRDAGPNKREQLIIFFTDHGIGTDIFEFEDEKKANKNTRTSLLEPFTPFEKDSNYASAIESNPAAIPGFEIIINPAGMPFDPLKGPSLGMNDLTIEAGDLRLSEYEWGYDSWNPQGMVGSDPRDELFLFFPVDKSVFLTKAIGDPYKLSLQNDSSQDLYITAVAQTTGSIRKLGQRPKPNILIRFFRWLFNLLFGWLLH
jgi:hypothetical protein